MSSTRAEPGGAAPRRGRLPEPVVALALAGGSGVRARPLTLASADYLRSKAVIRLAGRTLVEWAVDSLYAQGVEDFYVVANGRENRTQIKDVLDYGWAAGPRLRYNRPRFDRDNTGSGQATLRAMDHWQLTGLALVFPTDSVLDVDLAAMVRTQRATGAIVTVATVERTAEEAAAKYGVVRRGRGGLVTAFAEKPDLDRARAIAALSGHRAGTVETNAGLYLVDCSRLRAVGRAPQVRAMARQALDWGSDLIPYLVRGGHPVATHRVAGFGDLGSPSDYLRTLQEVLDGRYPALAGAGEPIEARVHASSLDYRDPVTGRTLSERIARGSVRVGPTTRIGRDVEVADQVLLEDTLICDGIDIGAGAQVRSSFLGDFSIVGPAARLTDTYISAMAEVRSENGRHTVLADYCVLGEGVVVHTGAHLRGVAIHPGLEVDADVVVPPGSRLTQPEDLARWHDARRATA